MKLSLDTIVCFILWVACLCGLVAAEAQLPDANFIIQSTACLNERIRITNGSTNATKFNWDFCEGDFLSTPVAGTIATLPDAYNTRNMDLVSDGNGYFAFVVSTGTNSIYRLDFGSSINNTAPVITNLGNVNNLLNAPLSIRIIKESNSWVGMLINNAGPSLVRLQFGLELSNNPTAETIVTDFTANNCLVLQDAGSKKILIATNINTNTLTIVNFGNSFLNLPVSGDIITTSALTGGVELDDIKLMNYNGDWYGLVVAGNSKKILRLDFGPDLFNSPAVVDVTGNLSLPGDFPTGISFQWDGGKLYSLVQSFSGKLYTGEYGTDFFNVNPTYTNIGNLSVLSNSINLELVKVNSQWFGFSIDHSNLKLNRFSFLNPCSSNQLSSEISNPSPIVYSQSSTHSISLTAIDNNNNSSYYSIGMTVSSLQAPDIDFTSQNVCINHDILFTSTNNSSDIMSYGWDFGDSNSASIENPIHQYNTSSPKKITLDVQASNGCQNFVEKIINVYEEPVPAFTLPSGLICTNNQFEFVNSTIDNFDGNLTFQWFVDNNLEASTRNLIFTFLNEGPKNIKLIASIPGCANELIQGVNLYSGPEVGFEIIGNCQNEIITFQNKSAGNIASYEWDLDVGTTSSVVNPENIYELQGVYRIELKTIGTNGCESIASKMLSINSMPEASFFIDLPPFSCAQALTQFHDNSAAMPDSNITSWSWKFNDGSGETANIQNPTHTFSSAGDYNIDLEVVTNYGCMSSVTLPVTISASPTAGFLTSAVCLNKPVTFTNSSSAGLLSSSWLINGAIYAAASPSITFNATGKYSASLTVKGPNLCENTITKELDVKPIPALDFITTAICAGQVTTLTDQSIGVDLPISWSWNFGNGNMASGSPVTYSFPSVGVFPVDMSVSTLAGCAYSFTKSITVATPPTALFTATPTFGPPPLVVQFTSTSSNASSLQWTFNDTSGSTASVPNPLFTFNDLGDYAVELTAYNSVGCSSTYSKTIKVLIPDIDLTLDDLRIKRNADNSFSPILTISNKSNVPISNANVLLNGSGGIRLTQAIQMNLIEGDVGEFTLPLELRSNDNYLCAEVQIIGDVNSLNNTQCINLTDRPIIVQPYPNPTHGKIFFEAVLAEGGSGSLEILNVSGKVIFKNDFDNLIPGMNQLQLDLSGNDPGLYLAIWEVNGQRISHKFLIQ